MKATTETTDKTAAKLKERINRWEAYVLQQQIGDAAADDALPAGMFGTAARAKPAESAPVSRGKEVPEEAPAGGSAGIHDGDEPSGVASAPVPGQSAPARPGPSVPPAGRNPGPDAAASGRQSAGGAGTAGEGSGDPKPVITGPVRRLDTPRPRVRVVSRDDSDFRISPLSTIDLGYDDPKQSSGSPASSRSLVLFLTLLIAAIVGVAFLVMHA